MKNRSQLMAKFLIPSIIGILIFMIPLPIGAVVEETGKRSMTVIVKVFADWLKNTIGYNNVAIVCLVILTLSALLALVAQAKPKFIMDKSITDFYDFTVDSFRLEGYDAPKLGKRLPVAV